MTKSNFIIAGLSIAVALVFYLLFQAYYPSSSEIQPYRTTPPVALEATPPSSIDIINDTSAHSTVTTEQPQVTALYKKTLPFPNTSITIATNALSEESKYFFSLPITQIPYTLEDFLSDNSKRTDWIKSIHQTTDNHFVYPEPSSAVAFSLINRQQYGSLLNNDSTKQPSYGTLSKSCSFGEDISLAGVLWKRLICKETFKDGEYQSITINSTCLTSIPNKESFLRVSYVLQNGDADACEFLKSLNLSAVVIE